MAPDTRLSINISDKGCLIFFNNFSTEVLLAFMSHTPKYELYNFKWEDLYKFARN
jgi:hypothetical protein